MAVNNTPLPRVQYTANGSQTAFTYNFEIPTTADIAVYVDSSLRTLTTHYTVSGAGTDGGGTVTFLSAPANGAKVTLIRNMALARTSGDFQASGPFYATAVNDELDKLWMAIQQLSERFQRTILAPPYTTTVDLSADSFQPIDATLTAIANASTGANKLHYFTGTDTVGVADLSAFARTILDDADGSAVRTTIGAAASSHTHAISDITSLQTTLDGKQPLDATLTAWAGVTTGADKLSYWSGSDTASTTDLTSFGRSLIDDANASAARTTLGLGTMATEAATSYQPIDATLTAWAGLTTAANKLGYWTGTDTAATTDLSAFGRSLIDDADASAARTTLGLGTMATESTSSYQAADAELTAIAGLTSAADRLPYFTGSGTASLATFTSFGRSLVDDADASAARTTLGAAATSHTHAQSDITNLTTDLAGKASTATTISAGAGLTGGGDLSANRTLALDIDGLSLEGTLDTSNDYLVMWDASASAHKKITVGSVASAGVSGVSSFNGRTGSVSPASGDYAVADITGLSTALSGKQNTDAELTALAGLTSAADALPYFTGNGTASTTTLSSFGRSLIDDADASAARTTLGLVIGTNVQAQDAELAAIAGLTSAADRLPYFTGSGTASLATFTSFGRSLVDDADAAGGRATLGLGTSDTPTFSSVTGTSEVYIGSVGQAERVFVIAISDETTTITTGTAKVTFRAPFAMTLTRIPKATLTTVSTSGNPTFDINEAGSSILGANKLSIDANELTSTTAATATTLADTSIADDAQITIDVDTAGTGAKGAKIYLYYKKA